MVVHYICQEEKRDIPHLLLNIPQNKKQPHNLFGLFIFSPTGKSSVSPPALALTALPHHPDSSEPSHPTAAPWDDASQTAAPHITSTISAWTDGTVHSGTAPMLTSSSGALASSDVPAATTAPAPTDRSTPGTPKLWMSTYFYLCRETGTFAARFCIRARAISQYVLQTLRIDPPTRPKLLCQR